MSLAPKNSALLRLLEAETASRTGMNAARLLWAVLGLLFLGLGLIGILVPLLPTTPLLLLSAFCFGRGSRRLHRWLIEHPRFGPPLEQWRAHRAISLTVKRNAVMAMLAMPAAAFLIGVPSYVVGLQCLVLVFPAAFILSRPRPPDDDAPQAQARSIQHSD